ncbi:MAG: FAD-dependent monooxygenase [Gammaproteobacteria bacterium]|nr:FAD-dependent monooxygenase [Gammaproteobacteria bacterium]
MDERARDQVIVVGAGPVGLVAALRLAEQGIPVTLIERETTLPHDLRASTFHPPTLEMLDTLGLSEPLIADGLEVPTWQVRRHETHERAEFDLSVIAGDTRYPFRLQCEQWKLCELAMARAEADDAIDIYMGHTFESLSQDDDGVRVQCRSADGEPLDLRGRYLIAADGSRSTIRGLLELPFEGLTYPETTILVTTHFPFEDHLPGLSRVNYVWIKGGTFSLLRLPDLWRCSVYAAAGETIEQALEPERIQTKLKRIIPSQDHFEILEIRPYRIHQRIIEHYRIGRVLMAGDAAHINSPSGGMGMNCGVHDAFNLTDKLARIYRGESTDLLDLYSRQRQPIAKEEILGQAHRNRTRMLEPDEDERTRTLRDLQATVADPVRARDYLLRSSMITGLRKAETLQ